MNAKRYRLFAGYTQEEMSQELSISLSAYKEKENGHTEFKQSEMMKFFVVLKQTIPDLKIESIFFNDICGKIYVNGKEGKK